MQSFKNAYVRDLAWVISSPCAIENPLIPNAKFFEDEYAAFLPQLRKLDDNSDELIKFLQKTKRKALGNYFEDLIEFWLQRREDTKILARGLQIRDGKLTIGECDFIAEIAGQVTHIEVAVKYYLAIENSTAQQAWVGRGLNDRLDIKLDRLFEHQLGLSATDAMQNVLHENNIPLIEEKMAILKGYFFQNYFTTNHSLPQNSLAEAEAAYWCKIDDIGKLPADFRKWQMLQKPHWFTDYDDWFDVDDLYSTTVKYFEEVKETPVLFNVLISGKATKFFIAPSLWIL